jgi:glutamate---cysteine ligase / carboxylate-amine ligase
MLLEPVNGDLAPLADEALLRVEGDPRFKRELPASQLEIMTAPASAAADAVDELRAARRRLAQATDGLVRLAAAGVHPRAPTEGELSGDRRYEHVIAEYGRYAHRQLVCALQVHVAPGGSDRALLIYNALRSYLPEIGALAANAPFHEGRATGLASVRPKIAELLPRQGVPPPLASWEEYGAALRWGATTGSLPYPSAWWWELRPHPEFGTLELRVPDAQTTVAEAAGVAAVAQCLVATLADRLDGGERLDVAPSWRIEENRWWAARDGVEGELGDLVNGERVATRKRLRTLLGELAPAAARLGCEAELAEAERLVAENGALRQRAVAEQKGIDGLVSWLAERWLAGA